VKLVTFALNGKNRPGVLVNNRVIDLAAEGLPSGPDGDLLEIIRGGKPMLEKIAALSARSDAISYGLKEVTLAAPVVDPQKVIGIGLNYVDHCKEANLKVPNAPIVFTKFSSSVTGPYADIFWTQGVTTEVDYEVELGIVIGKAARDVSEAAALDYVLGYTVVNDVTARDMQFSDDAGQWDRGKSLDSFCPYGPYIVTKDEIPNPQSLDMTCVLNGKEMQRSNTSNMIFGVAKIISFISQSTTLLPGDLIATGTPFGVGFSRKPPVYLQDGDFCICEVQGLGSVRNKVRVIKR